MSNLKQFAIKLLVIAFVITGSLIMLKIFGIRLYKKDVHNHEHITNNITQNLPQNNCPDGQSQCLEYNNDKLVKRIYCAEGECDE